MGSLLKIGIIDFFGILLPGAFFLLNAAIFYNALDVWFDLPTVSKEFGSSWSGLIYFAAFVLAYFMGTLLRVIPPDLVDWFSIRLAIALKAVVLVFKLPLLLGSTTFQNLNKSLRDTYRFRHSRFPYLDYFAHSRTNWNDTMALLNNIKNPSTTNQFRLEQWNYLKRTVLAIRNPSATEDLHKAEATIRLLSGTVMTLAISIAVLFGLGYYSHIRTTPHAGFYIGTAIVYSLLLLATVHQYRKTRTKEVSAVLDYCQLMSISERINSRGGIKGLETSKLYYDQ